MCASQRRGFFKNPKLPHTKLFSDPLAHREHPKPVFAPPPFFVEGTDTTTNTPTTHTDDIVIGVVTTVVSAVVLGVAKKCFGNRSSTSAR